MTFVAYVVVSASGIRHRAYLSLLKAEADARYLNLANNDETERPYRVEVCRSVEPPSSSRAEDSTP